LASTEAGVTTAEHSPHYGAGTAILGVVVWLLALVYAVQVAGVLHHTRYLLAHPLPMYTPDGAMQFDVRTVANYDFFVTSHAWLLGHAWLLWVIVVQFARRPKKRVRFVRGLGVAFVLVASVTWVMVLWLAKQGTSV
jgi:hypothetical protein